MDTWSEIDASHIRLRLWGVRGGIATPGADTIRYGGNTACVELRCGPHLLILDAGTGLRGLGQHLASNPGPVSADLLISHAHLDHICGLPFFQPHYDPTAHLRIWGGHFGQPDALAQALAVSWSPPLMPDLSHAFRAYVRYCNIAAGETFTLHPGLTVRTAALRHPGGATGYRVDWAGRSVGYITDAEHAQGKIEDQVAALIHGADLMLVDASYTDAEYEGRKGWGHSTWQEAIELADSARPGTEVAREQVEFNV